MRDLTLARVARIVPPPAADPGKAYEEHGISCRPRMPITTPARRLRHGSCELVVLRSNLQCLLRGTAVVPPMPGSTPFQHAVASVAQQSHLCPVPLEVQVRK